MRKIHESGQTREAIGKPRSASVGASMYYAAWKDHQPEKIANLPVGVTGNIVEITRYKNKDGMKISYCLQVGGGILNKFGLPSQFWLVLSDSGGWVGEYEHSSQRRSHTGIPELKQESLW